MQLLQATFRLEPQSVQTALWEYQEAGRRRMVVPIYTRMDVQTARITDFCRRLAPGCVVYILPVGPDSFRLRVKDSGNVLIDSEAALYAHELAAESDEELWKLLENAPPQKIKRQQ